MWLRGVSRVIALQNERRAPTIVFTEEEPFSRPCRHCAVPGLLAAATGNQLTLAAGLFTRFEMHRRSCTCARGGILNEQQVSVAQILAPLCPRFLSRVLSLCDNGREQAAVASKQGCARSTQRRSRWD